MNELPIELIYNITESLPGIEILKLCQTNSYFNQICQNSRLWSMKIKQDFPTTIVPTDKTAKDTYISLIDQRINRLFTTNIKYVLYQFGQILLLSLKSMPFKVEVYPNRLFMDKPDIWIGSIDLYTSIKDDIINIYNNNVNGKYFIVYPDLYPQYSINTIVDRGLAEFVDEATMISILNIFLMHGYKILNEFTNIEPIDYQIGIVKNQRRN